MAGNAIIGALRVVLGLDTAQFDEGLRSSQRQLNTAAGQFKKIGGDMTALGARMSLALTAPLVAMGIAAAGAAGNFEASMNKVGVATQATAKEMAVLEAKALKIGKTTVFSANQAAGAMESLAKAGVSTKAILEGAADATVNLAAATGSELDPAATAISDSLAQFHLSAAALPAVVDQITGAVNESKLSFEDYQLGMGMAGGAAGAAGVSFTDFNAVLAGTSSMFSSGSDAGTSFKTFLNFLVPQSEEAARTIKALGLEFYNADGSLKGMAEVAGQLREKLGGLTEEAQNKALKKIFGADAMRTAIGLMNLGADGLDKIKDKIAETDAAAQAAKLMEGLNGQLNRLKNAFEGLAIAIGNSGLLEALTTTVTAIAGVVSNLSEAHPLILGVGVAIAGLAAVVGPVILIMGAFATSIGSIISLAATFSPVMLAMGGAMLRIAGQATIAGAAMRGLGVAMSFMLGPWGLVIMGVAAAVAVLAMQLSGAASVSKEMKKTTDAVTTAMDAYEGAVMRALTATGKEKDSALEAVKAKRALLQETIRVAKAKLAEADATVALIEAETRRKIQSDRYSFRGDAAGSTDGANPFIIARENQARADAKAARDSINGATSKLNQLEAALAAPINLGGGGGGGGTGTYNAESADEKKKREKDQAAKREELELQAKLDAAREAADYAQIRALETKLDLRQRTSAYEDAGLSKEAALVAATRDQLAIEKAREAARKRALDEREDEVSLAVAEELGQSKIVDLLERKAEKTRLVTWYQEQGLDLAAATARAESDLLKIDQARLRTREKLVAELAEEHAIELAKRRGDSEAEIRALERAAEQRKRAERYEKDLGLTPDEAASRAGLELDQEEQARQQGIWRDTIKGAFRAAMDGDLAGFAENWLKDWASKGLETALNDVADLLYQLFKNAFSQVDTSGQGGGSGGWLNSLISWGVGLFTGGGGTTATSTGTSTGGIQGFATGGSFKVGGAGQADSKLISMRLTPGEMVDIRKPGNDNGPSGQVVFDMRGALTTPELLNQVNGMVARGSALAVGAARAAARSEVPAAMNRKARGKLR